jgi:Fanconi anemia group M protein
MHVEHERIRPEALVRRDYQVSIAVEATKRNTLVVLPTGLGKTVVAVLVMAHRLHEVGGRCLFLAPTKPLVEQHAEFVEETLLADNVEVFTGDVAPDERATRWRETEVICATPQVIQNDVIAGRIDLSDVGLLVFDEAHRAVGDYAYVFIADQYKRARLEGLTLGLTASPGSDPDKIQEVCRNCGVEGVEVRTEADEDVEPYVQDVDIEWEEVKVPETLERVADVLDEILEELVDDLRGLGFYGKPYVSKGELLDLQNELQAKLAETPDDEAWPVYQGLSKQAAALKVHHAKDLAETQGVGALRSYLERLEDDDTKAAERLMDDPRMDQVRDLVERSNVEHPKLRKAYLVVRDQLEENPDSRIIVFTHYRDMADLLTEELEKAEGPIEPVRFVGQASRGESDKGLTQNQQVEILDDFREGEYNTLVATSVAEEGLDIPSTDLVVFYEPVASEIRTIQRRGRTGRREAGRVVILITEETKDEAHHWASKGKEKKMRQQVQALKRRFSNVNASREGDEWKQWFNDAEQTQLDSYSGDEPPAPDEDRREPAVERGEGDEDKPHVVADTREFHAEVVKALARRNVPVESEQLEVGDYVVSDRLGIERKEAGDYAASLTDGRLFEQVKGLRDAYAAPLVILEGEAPLEGRNIDPAAWYGSIASLVADFRVPVVQTADAEETADLLASLANREQDDEDRPVALRHPDSSMAPDEQIRFVAEGLPGVSSARAEALLDHFGSLQAIFAASQDQLTRVDGIGPETARRIRTVLEAPYGGETP